MRIVLGPAVALESVIARRSEPLPAALLSSRLVTLKTAGARRPSSDSSRGRNLRGRTPTGRPGDVGLLTPLGQERTADNGMTASPPSEKRARGPFGSQAT